MAKIKKRTGAIGAVLIIISMIIGIFIGYLIGRSTAVVPTPSEDDVTHVVGTPVVEESMEVETSVEETEIETETETETEEVLTGDLEIGEVVLTVGDRQVTMEEMNYYLYSVRDYYVRLYGEEPWGQTMEDGRTVAESAKEQLLNDTIKTLLLVAHADDYGIVLSEEMKAQLADSAHDYVANLGSDICKQFGIKASAVANVYSVNELANQVHVAIDDSLRTEIKANQEDITDEALEQMVMDAYNALLNKWRSETEVETTEIWDSIVVGSVG